ncbi:MAG: YjbQ family protein, partial [Sphingobacteriia bacterium]|nr:YjbQ family protein [Sphingobacteriia bacterium]
MRETIPLTTHRDQELVDITAEVHAVVKRSGIRDG